QRAIALAEKSEERAIEPDQALALVQVGKGNAEAKLHEVRIIVEFFSALPYSSRERPMQIKNSVFLVTGGASGLGAASARMAADNGAKVVIADMQTEAGEKLARELGGRFAKTDVASEADGKAAVAVALKEFGGVQVLVNCAGIAIAERTIGKEAPHDLGRFERVLKVNLIGTFNMIRLAADAMAKA